jgi:hypothetical protein
VSSGGTLYGILGLAAGATRREIKSAFRRLALRHHPDRNRNSDEAAARFRVVRNAYDVLSDPARRVEYDTFLSRSAFAFRQGSAAPTEHRRGWQLAGSTDDAAAILGHLHWVLWDIEDLVRSEPDWAVEFSGISLQWYVENMLRFIDRWVLTPAGFPGYLHQAADLRFHAELSGVVRPGPQVGGHSPFGRVTDYFYHIRLRVDELFRKEKLTDLLRPIPDTDIRLLDSILEAHNYCVHYLAHLKRCLSGEATRVPEFRHTIQWFADRSG